MDRHVSLVADEIHIKPSLFYNISTDEVIGLDDHKKPKADNLQCSNHALVLMATSISKRFKQPLAYCFSKTTYSGERLEKLIKDCISKMTKIGFIVHNLISDMGSNFTSLAKRLNVTPEKSYFEVEGRKIYYIFDPPHLLKATRNNMFNNNFFIGEKQTDWRYIQMFYDEDSSETFRLAPNLTQKHMQPKAFKKMNVKLAAQVLSARVAAGMTTYMKFKKIPPEAAFTIEVIAKFDNLFDIFNCFTHNSPKAFRTPFKGEQFKIDFLLETSEYIKNINVVSKSKLDKDLTNTVSFLDGWRISISSLIGLWNDLKDEGFSYILTRRLNQDPLENFFGTIRQQGGNSVNPTPVQFTRAFKKLFLMSFLQHSGAGGNCEEDFDELLVNIKEMGDDTASNMDMIEEVDDEYDEDKETIQNELNEMKMSVNDYNEVDLIKHNGLSYVAGYFAMKILLKHKCSYCTSQIRSDFNQNDETQHYLNVRQYEGLSSEQGLIPPSADWVKYISELEEIFHENFLTNMQKPRVLLTILMKMINKPAFTNCKTFPKLYFLKFFIRVRIYFTLKFINQSLHSNQKNIKLLIPTNQI